MVKAVNFTEAKIEEHNGRLHLITIAGSRKANTWLIRNLSAPGGGGEFIRVFPQPSVIDVDDGGTAIFSGYSVAIENHPWVIVNENGNAYLSPKDGMQAEAVG